MESKNKIARKAYSLALGKLIKYVNKDRKKGYYKLVDITEKFAGKRFKKSTYEKARKMIDDDNKWVSYADNLLDTLSPNVLKTSLLNLGYEAALVGNKTRHKYMDKYGCNIPWVILMDPTSACNLHCTGCWAAEYGNRLNLTYDELDSIIKQGKEMGCHFFMYTGGEPLVRKDDIIKLCKKYNDCEFLAFTNATLITDDFCKEVEKVGNLAFAISLEGFEATNDDRRGKDSFNKVMSAMDKLKSHGCLFGTSICYTSKNIETVTSDDFLDMIIEKGCKYIWYFHYMPVGNKASLELLPKPEQRKYMYQRVREIRGFTGGKKIFAIDFQNDGEFIGGCIAGGRNYLHINPNGDMEPCVFIHYSDSNIRKDTILEALQKPLFMAYKEGQPFNKNHLRPCPMLENPEKIRAIVKKTNAKSTDLESTEDVDHVYEKCMTYATGWTPMAEALWKKREAEKAKKDKNK